MSGVKLDNQEKKSRVVNHKCFHRWKSLGYGIGDLRDTPAGMTYVENGRPVLVHFQQPG